MRRALPLPGGEIVAGPGRDPGQYPLQGVNDRIHVFIRSNRDAHALRQLRRVGDVPDQDPMLVQQSLKKLFRRQRLAPNQNEVGSGGVRSQAGKLSEPSDEAAPRLDNLPRTGGKYRSMPESAARRRQRNQIDVIWQLAFSNLPRDLRMGERNSKAQTGQA
jgi:hypothetical protein